MKASDSSMSPSCRGGSGWSLPSALREMRRQALGIGYALRGKRLRQLPSVLAAVVMHVFAAEASARELSDPATVSLPPGGLVGVSNDLGPDRLLRAYRLGMYPWRHVGPMKWWSPEERMVLFVNETHISKGVRKLLRRDAFRITFDEAFQDVVRACAAPRDGRTKLTWITPEIVAAYGRLHEQGHAHSIECWNEKGELVGGVYGVAIGRIFFGESQFSRERDASKYASAVLMAHLSRWGYVLRDAKWRSDYLASLGFRTISRESFRALLDDHCGEGGRAGRWALDPAVDAANWKPQAAVP
jgi:leucyl/phenylalanyl-tRNA--protein transferase